MRDTSFIYSVEPEPPYGLNLAARNATIIELGWIIPVDNGRPILYFTISVFQVDPPGVNFTQNVTANLQKTYIYLPSGSGLSFIDQSHLVS